MALVRADVSAADGHATGERTQGARSGAARAAEARVLALRRRDPGVTVEVLAERIIRRACGRTAAVGALTSSAGLVPGLGTIASITVGVAADVTATLRLQADMVLELAALYGVRLAETDRTRVLAIVTGVSSASTAAAGKVGRKLARVATERAASRWVAHAVPFVSVAATAGLNSVSTYMIGRSATLYFKRAAAASA